MLTKDFITRMEEIGCSVQDRGDELYVLYNGDSLGYVSTYYPYVMATYYSGLKNCGLDATSLSLINRNMGRLSRTEIMDRSELSFYLAIDLPLVSSCTLYFGYKDGAEGVYSLDYAMPFTQEEIDTRFATGFYPVDTNTLA